jgi:ribonucleoside-diphosphate reductase alpha chain
MVEHPNIKSTTSIIDFIFRSLAYEYLGRNDLVHVLDKPEVENVGNAAWDPSTPTIGNRTPELSEVRVMGGAGNNAKEKNITHQQPLDAMSAAAKSRQSDAPACTNCGAITTRSGSCYKCENCGTQGGCS